MWRDDLIYRAYLDIQIGKTLSYMDVLLDQRTWRLAQQWRQVAPFLGALTLCVGCRHDRELNILNALGAQAVGIDLVATGRVLEMDMHDLKFPAESFDAVYSCHSLEHAYDLDRVLAEWRRVTKPGGVWVIEMPIQFKPSATDRHDVRSIAGLQARLGRMQTLWAGEGPTALQYIGRLQ